MTAAAPIRSIDHFCRPLCCLGPCGHRCRPLTEVDITEEDADQPVPRPAPPRFVIAVPISQLG